MSALTWQLITYNYTGEMCYYWGPLMGSLPHFWMAVNNSLGRRCNHILLSRIINDKSIKKHKNPLSLRDISQWVPFRCSPRWLCCRVIMKCWVWSSWPGAAADPQEPNQTHCQSGESSSDALDCCLTCEVPHGAPWCVELGRGNVSWIQLRVALIGTKLTLHHFFFYIRLFLALQMYW